jgi:hypothetical protein
MTFFQSSHGRCRFFLHHVTRFFLFTSRIHIFFLHPHRRYPLLRINLHIAFLHTFIFSELLNLFVMSDNVTVTVTFLLSQEHSQRDQIYVFKILFCLTVQSHLHQIQYVHMAHGFPPPFCTGKMFLQDENCKIFCSFFFY